MHSRWVVLLALRDPGVGDYGKEADSGYGCGIACTVTVRGKTPPKEFVAMAQSFDIPLMVTDYSLFVACGRLYMNGIRGLDGSW